MVIFANVWLWLGIRSAAARNDITQQEIENYGNNHERQTHAYRLGTWR